MRERVLASFRFLVVGHLDAASPVALVLCVTKEGHERSLVAVRCGRLVALVGDKVIDKHKHIVTADVADVVVTVLAELAER